ncbi:hypothetical protein ACQPX6_21410 [Actinomycetospora sp. CA-101289]|uniref:hypothetical protein n=1 Tax=Actinomycetospora sp. CA-101289 TaxID=3239893 RepID=UPI003D96F6AF
MDDHVGIASHIGRAKAIIQARADGDIDRMVGLIEPLDRLELGKLVGTYARMLARARNLGEVFAELDGAVSDNLNRALDED